MTLSADSCALWNVDRPSRWMRIVAGAGSMADDTVCCCPPVVAGGTQDNILPCGTTVKICRPRRHPARGMWIVGYTGGYPFTTVAILTALIVMATQTQSGVCLRFNWVTGPVIRTMDHAPLHILRELFGWPHAVADVMTIRAKRLLVTLRADLPVS